MRQIHWAYQQQLFGLLNRELGWINSFFGVESYLQSSLWWFLSITLVESSLVFRLVINTIAFSLGILFFKVYGWRSSLRMLLRFSLYEYRFFAWHFVFMHPVSINS